MLAIVVFPSFPVTRELSELWAHFSVQAMIVQGCFGCTLQIHCPTICQLVGGLLCTVRGVPRWRGRSR